MTNQNLTFTDQFVLLSYGFRSMVSKSNLISVFWPLSQLHHHKEEVCPPGGTLLEVVLTGAGSEEITAGVEIVSTAGCAGVDAGEEGMERVAGIVLTGAAFSLSGI